MTTEYCRQMLRVVVAQICQHLGWHSTNSTPLEVLTDVTERYILDVSKLTHQYAEQYGRTKVNLNDLGLAFRTMDISISELEDYIKHVDAFPFEKELMVFPKPKKSKLGYPNPKSREIYHREEHIPHYLPYMFPGMEDEVEVEEEVSPPPTDTPASQAGNTTPVSLPNSQEAKSTENLSETSPNLRTGEKRPLSSPTEGQMYKRQRLTNNNLPEEAGHSQYEMTSVKMLPSGLLSPVKNEGKLPEASLPQIFTPVEKKKEPVVKEVPKKITAGVTSDGSKLEDKENITVKKTNSNQKDPGKTNPTKTPVKSIGKGGSNIPSNKTGKKSSITKGKITKITKKTTNRTVVAGKSVKGKVMNKNSVKNVSNKSSVKNPSNKNSSKTDFAPPGSPGSCLKELLLHPKAEKSKTTKVDKKLPYSSTPSVKSGGAPVKVPSNLLMPANAMALSKNLHSVPDDDSSSDESPEPRLVIAESDPKPKEKGESKWGKSAKFDSIQGVGKKGEQSTQEKSKAGAGPKEKKTTTQKKKKEPVKRSTSESIDACINTVVRNYSAAATRERKQRELDAIPKSDADAMVAAATAAVVSAAAAATAASSAALNTTALSSPAVKTETPETSKKGDKKPQKKKKNVTKEKSKKLKMKTKVIEQNDKENAEVPEKLKEKMQQNVQHQNSPGPDRTPLACPDRFASEAWKIYDFDGSPPVSRCCSSPVQGSSSHSVSPSPKQMSPTVMDSLTLLSTAATSAANAMGMLPSVPFMPTDLGNLSMQDSDLSQLKMKIGLKKGGKGKIKSKLKSKIKEHKKEKKEKKKDKEKKKKTKEREEKKQKDKERIKEDNYQCTVVPHDGQVSTPLSVPRLKLNIKIGSSTPVAVASDDGSNKPVPSAVSLSITERSPSNASKQREPPQSPSLSRPEIPRLVIRTPVPPTVMSPPVVMSPPMAHTEKPEKILKPEKPLPKTKPPAKKKAGVKKAAVKKVEKKVTKKGPKMAAYPLDKRASFPPAMMPAEFPELASGSKQMMYPNVGEMHHPVMKAEKQVAVKPMMKQAERVMMPTNLDKPEMDITSKTNFKGEIGFTKVGNITPRATTKAGRGKGAKGGKGNRGMAAKADKLPVKAKPESVPTKTKTAMKAERVPMTKVPVVPTDIPVAPRAHMTRVAPVAKMPIMKPEKAILTKEKPIMKINRPPNRLGRPPKVEVPSSPPPTIPYPSSPSHKSHLSTLPIAHPLTHQSFNPLIPSVSNPIANMSRLNPIPVPTPIPKLHTPPVPKVQPTPKVTPKSHTGRGGKTGRPSRAASKNLQNSRNSGMSTITSFRENMTDSIRTQPENPLTPTLLLPSPLTHEQLLKAEHSFNTAQKAANIQVAGASTLELPYMMPLDAKGSTMVMEPSDSSNLLGKRTVQRSVFAETVGTFFDENGHKVWICPGCTLPDDGSPMIGCDDCDEWYHWPCVNIKEEPPEEDQWFCPKCLLKTKHKPKRKRKRRTY